MIQARVTTASKKLLRLPLTSDADGTSLSQKVPLVADVSPKQNHNQRMPMGLSSTAFVLLCAALVLALLSLAGMHCSPSLSKNHSGKDSVSPSLPDRQRTALEAAKLHPENIRGKLFVITGAYGGIGNETTRALLAVGGRVVVGGRSMEKVNGFVEKLAHEFNAKDRVDGGPLDLADLDSVKSFARYVHDKYNDDDIVLINNAGVVAPAAATKQGLELQMGVNVVGHHLLAKLLLPKTRRQVWLTSTAHLWDGAPRLDLDYFKSWSLEKDAEEYDFWVAYRESKLADILISKEFSRRYPQLETASCHPGMVYTDMGKHVYESSFSFLEIVIDFIKEFRFVVETEALFKPVKSPEQGASTTITAASLPSNQLVSGGYYKDCALGQESEAAMNMDDARDLFDWCEEVTKAYQVTFQ